MWSITLASPLFGANSRGIIVFGFEIYYYALCIVSGIIIATVLSALLMKRRNMSPDFIFTLFIFCIPVALICTRLFYCITDGMPISKWFSWSSIRNGGLSVIGGVIGGVGTGLVVCLVKKVNFFRAADCVVITILLAQAIGRWGNYFNEEVYGPEVTNAALQWFPFAVHIGSKWYMAFFFYEGFVNLIGFALLFSAAWFLKKKPNGLLTFAYFVWYGTVRSIMEPLRNSNYILSGGGVPWSLVFSILMVVFGVAGIVTLLVLNYRKEGALLGSKTGDPCGITEYLTPYKDDTPYFSKINLMGAKYPPKPEEDETEKIPFSERVSDLIAKIKNKLSPSDENETEESQEEKEGEDGTKEDSLKEEPKAQDEPSESENDKENGERS